jgi:hypothetical protein
MLDKLGCFVYKERKMIMSQMVTFGERGVCHACSNLNSMLPGWFLLRQLKTAGLTFLIVFNQRELFSRCLIVYCCRISSVETIILY